MIKMEVKREWQKPEILYLGIENTKDNFLGPGNDGTWQESGLFGNES